AKIGALVVEKQLPVRMLYGKHDRIILSTRAGHFHKKLQPFCELHIIDAGHNLLQAKFAATITSLLTI
ncbi:MAG: alpha/beta hydrolase, partial [Chitinophagaceae bacterium]